MKKTSKLFGAVACSAALAIGCAMPAFAVEEAPAGTNPEASVSTDVEKFTTDNNVTTASTSVDVLYQAKQIKAEVPLKVTIVASGAPGTAGDVLAPKASEYKITNTGTDTTSYAKIKVSKVDTTVDANGDWALVNAVTTSTPASKGELALTLKGSTGGAETVNLFNALSGSQSATWEASPTNTASEPTAVELQLAGKSNPTNAIQNASLAGGTNKVVLSKDAFTIKYTVEAM